MGLLHSKWDRDTETWEQHDRKNKLRAAAWALALALALFVVERLQ